MSDIELWMRTAHVENVMRSPLVIKKGDGHYVRLSRSNNLSYELIANILETIPYEELCENYLPKYTQERFKNYCQKITDRAERTWAVADEPAKLAREFLGNIVNLKNTSYAEDEKTTKEAAERTDAIRAEIEKLHAQSKAFTTPLFKSLSEKESGVFLEAGDLGDAERNFMKKFDPTCSVEEFMEALFIYKGMRAKMEVARQHSQAMLNVNRNRREAIKSAFYFVEIGKKIDQLENEIREINKERDSIISTRKKLKTESVEAQHEALMERYIRYHSENIIPQEKLRKDIAEAFVGLIFNPVMPLDA